MGLSFSPLATTHEFMATSETKYMTRCGPVFFNGWLQLTIICTEMMVLKMSKSIHFY
jgi:hypothetical protein